MPQKTNLNINPYYDDFDKDDNFYRVLFKPGFPVQARELTTLQSILQNQIESFGSHIFKEGSMVIPGGITYDRFYEAVRVNPTHFGLDVDLYLNSFVGKKISGAQSGVTATVEKVIFPPTLGVEEPTLYVKYLNSDNSFTFNPFSSGETLITEDTVTYGNTTIQIGDTFASTIDVNATSTAAAVHVSKGVYFIRGTFVDVPTDTIVLDPYTNNPSYRVGFTISEELVSAGDDDSLYDNARGFSNYAAPGADRLKISVSLSKKELTDYDDKNFVELVRVDNGELKKLQNKSTYSIIKDYFAKRTFEESGDYAVSEFGVDLGESLDNKLSNGGFFVETQKTEQNNDPSEDLYCARVSPGKAYVRGFDIEFPGSQILDADKPRDTTEVTGASIPFEMGNLIKVNNVQGTPFVGINNTDNVVKLQSYRKGTSGAAGINATGETIGQARVYSFALADNAYDNTDSQFDLYMFDVQTYTKLVLNELVFAGYMPQSSYIKGLSSGATGYVVQAPGASGTTGIQLTQTSGEFIVGEQISINESTSYRRTIIDIEAKSIKDVKSIWQERASIGGISTDFSADTALFERTPIGFDITDKITISPTGIVTCAGKTFSGISTNSVIKFQRNGIGLTAATFNRVAVVSSDLLSLTLEALPTVFGVCDGDLPAEASTETTFSVMEPKIFNEENSYLYAELSNPNVASVKLDDSNLTISHQVRDRTISATGTLSLNTNTIGFTSAFFEPFDADRYSIVYSDGTLEPLDSSQIEFADNSTTITFSGLAKSGVSSATVNTTVKRQSVQSKQKDFDRSVQVIVSSTANSESAGITGLSSSFYYGLRVEDREISLNTPDVVDIVAVYESLGTSTPTLDTLQFVSGLGLDVNAIIGERVIGQTSKAVGQIVTRPSTTDVGFVYLNANKFIVGETVKFEESLIESNLQSIVLGNYLNITDRYDLDAGQREQYYDYSRIVRRKQSVSPSRKLLIIFNKYTVPSNDSGDFYTVDSYSSERYKNDIPLLRNNTVRASDVLDFRPRVADFNASTANRSPFAFESRSFGSSSVNTTAVVAPNESTLLGYDHYMGRIDKIVLDKEGNLSLVQGTSAVSPKEPTVIEDSMTIARITLPPYLFDVDDAEISLVDNRRYTMRDIGGLEDRIENLETFTSLSALELSTQSLQVQDAQGLDRFKSGFFVDDFADNGRIDLGNADTKVSVESDRKELQSLFDVYSLELQPAFDSSVNMDTADLSADLPLLDPNTQKTGDLITLKYEQKGWIEQPLASRVENVNPFNMIEFVGAVELTPASDNWVRNVFVPGGTRRITGGWNGSFIDNVLIDRRPETFMRSRNIMFQAGGLRPLARHYPFMDSIGGIDLVPKLIEINMTSGTFDVGEDIDGFIGPDRVITFRAARPDHKDGPYDAPTLTYNANPYNKAETFGTSYSASATVVNVDVPSLAAAAIGKYNGFVVAGVNLVGRSSGATASVTDSRLIADPFGDILGTFFIRNPLATPPPSVRIRTGERIFRLTSSDINAEPLPGSKLISSGETTYNSTGIVQTFRQDTVIVRRPPPPPRRRRRKDPLAQSFTVDETGAFLTSVDLFFANKDPNEKCYVEIRTVELGTPTNQLVQDFARAILYPDDITTSTDASVATNVKFPSPIYLEANREYAVVVLSPTSNNYELWIAQMGERTVNGQNLPDAEAVMVTKQYIGGSLFKSQNGTIWTASQFEDLKFKLYKANFTSQKGSAFFYNPNLDVVDENVPALTPDAVKILPRKLDVGITTVSLNDVADQLVIGARVKANNSLSNGYIERVGGAVSFTGITTAIAGAGYSTGTYPNVTLYPIVGRGRNLVAETVTFNDAGGVSQIVLNTAGLSTGNGWATGDVVGITTSQAGGRGSGAQLSIRDVNGVDTLYLTNVQGEEITAGGLLQIYTGSTAGPALADTSITSSSPVGGEFAGNVFEVTHYNHGMTADNNIVSISGVDPDTIPTQLSVDLDLSDSVIALADTTSFSRFEGITTAAGYLKVNNEIIYYDSIASGQLGIATRGVDGSAIQKHASGSQVYKYEIGEVSLTRINKQHDMSSTPALSNLREIDSYHLEFDRGSRGTGEAQLSFRQESQVGGMNIFASRNVQYDVVQPQFNIITPGQGSKVSATMRSVSGTSAGGAEPSFIDQGFEPVLLNAENDLNSTRLVCSKLNETTRLTSLPRNRSFTIGISMESTDSNLSPTIDTQTAFAGFGRHRLNNPISDYVNDSRSNSVSDDPHAFVYISNRVNLAQPASSLKVFVAANRDASADFRVLYRLFKSDSSEIEQSYVLFPGYDNLNDTNGDGFGDDVVDSSKNSGRADAFVVASANEEFREYQFSIDNLDQFSGYQIKIVASGTNEAKSPTFKDLRAIALA